MAGNDAAQLTRDTARMSKAVGEREVIRRISGDVDRGQSTRKLILVVDAGARLASSMLRSWR